MIGDSPVQRRRAPAVASAERQVSADDLTGLSTAEAARRLAAEGTNELTTGRRRTLLHQAWTVVREPMIALLLAAGTVNFLLAEPLDGGLLMATVVLLIAITLYQERKTENALAALRDLSSPRALVIRDGERRRIPGREVVRGDLVVLSEGDRVPADSVLVEAVNLSVDESALTGESVPVRKSATAAAGAESSSMGRPGGDDTPWAYAATLVVRGHGLAVVKTTAMRTEVGRIGKALQSIEVERTPLQSEVDRIVRVVGVAGVAAVVLVILVYGATRGDWLQGLLAGIAAAMAMLPEEFPVVLTVFLTLGALRMSRRHVLTRRSAVIETLGSATALCVDKTGTLTMNRMTVRELIVGPATWRAGGAPPPEEFHALLEYAVLASSATTPDPMDRAFVELGEQVLAGTGRLHPGWTMLREYPLTAAMLAVAHVWRPPHGDEDVVAAKGAPEAVAGLCRLGEAERREAMEQVEAATAAGHRVLAVADAAAPRDRALPETPHPLRFRWRGLVALQDPLRPDVPDAVRDCRGAGIRVLMITGDYPGTALAIAREAGLEHTAECVTGAEVDAMSDPELAARIRTIDVFARMVPEQKLRLVRALQADGEVVGMTGDGVNDAPALRAADIGIAMGARGTDVAREAAALVITDDDFTSIVEGVRQGRGIFENLRKAMTYILAVHVPIFGMALLPVFLAGWPLVLLPVQIAFLELIIDPACSIVFEAEEVDPGIMERRPRRRGGRAIDRRGLIVAALQGSSVLAAVAAVYIATMLAGQPESVVRSMSFAALVAGNIALILVNRSWGLSVWSSFRRRRNRALTWVLAGTATVLAVTLAVPPVQEVFGFTGMKLWEWLVALAAGTVSVLWFEIYKITGRLRER